jgi:hypothetical protein
MRPAGETLADLQILKIIHSPCTGRRCTGSRRAGSPCPGGLVS